MGIFRDVNDGMDPELGEIGYEFQPALYPGSASRRPIIGDNKNLFHGLGVALLGKREIRIYDPSYQKYEQN